MNPPSAAERVAAGAAWLDTNEPGWVTRMSLPDFDISSPCDCVFGQVFDPGPGRGTGFTVGLRKFIHPDEVCGLGFDIYNDEHSERKRFESGYDPEDDYDELQAEWEKLITDRQTVTP